MRANDPQSIFDNAGKASDAPTAQQLTTPRMHTEFVSAKGDLITDDPQAKVTVVVRPNHNYGGVPAGMEVTVPRIEFEAAQATLCSRAEYARITAIASSPGHQNLQRQIQAMREAQSDAFRRSLTTEQRALLEQRQAEARADDEKDLRLRQDMAQAATGPAAAAKWAGELPPPPRTPAELAQRESAIRVSYDRAKAGLSPKAQVRLNEAMEEELTDLREAYKTAAPSAQIEAKRPVKERLADLLDLYTGSLIDEATYKQRQAQILAEV